MGLLLGRHRRRRRKLVPVWLPGLALIFVAWFLFDGRGRELFPGACAIKGNIGAAGERIYHVPGGEHYAATRIDVTTGERWFCTEAEARAAGWRRARR